MATTKTPVKKTTGASTKKTTTKTKPATPKATTAKKKQPVAPATATSRLQKEIDPQFSLLVIVALGLLGIVGILLWNAVAAAN